MAAEHAEAGHGLADEGHFVEDVESKAPKVVGGVKESAPVDVKNGAESFVEGAPDHEDTQVAKKPRVEKVVNGGEAKTDGPEVTGTDEAAEEKTETDHLAGHNGVADTEDKSDEGSEEQDFENGAGEGDDDDQTEEGAGEVTKDGHGDGGLRTLLHEGDTKSTILNHDLGDATHMLNRAK